jgi:hypothetical protein
VGAVSLSALFGNLESLGKQAKLAGAGAAFESALAEYQRVLAAIGTFLSDGQGLDQRPVATQESAVADRRLARGPA